MKGEASRNRDLHLPKVSGRSILIIKDFFNWNILLPNLLMEAVGGEGRRTEGSAPWQRMKGRQRGARGAGSVGWREGQL